MANVFTTPKPTLMLNKTEFKGKIMLFKNVDVHALKILLLGSFFMYSTPGFANPYEPIEHIKSVVKNFVVSNTEVNANETIDINVNQSSSQFQVPVCSREINAGLPMNGNKERISTVELTCDGAQPWRIFVPVDVQIYTKVITAKRTIPARETVMEEDIDYTLSNKNRLYTGYFTRKEDVVGNVTAHIITAGAVLTKKNLQLPILIHKNQAISLIAKSNAVVVTMTGIAKTEGALNTLIKVFNPSSKRTMDAIVIGPNQAQVVT